MSNTNILIICQLFANKILLPLIILGGCQFRRLPNSKKIDKKLNFFPIFQVRKQYVFFLSAFEGSGNFIKFFK